MVNRPNRPKTGGRKKGVPNKLTQSIRGAIAEAFDELGGVASLVTWGRANKDEFYKLWGRLAPQEITGKDGAPLLPTDERQRRVMEIASGALERRDR